MHDDDPSDWICMASTRINEAGFTVCAEDSCPIHGKISMHKDPHGVPQNLEALEKRVAFLEWRLETLLTSFKHNDLLSRVIKLEKKEPK